MAAWSILVLPVSTSHPGVRPWALRSEGLAPTLPRAALRPQAGRPPSLALGLLVCTAGLQQHPLHRAFCSSDGPLGPCPFLESWLAPAQLRRWF